MKDTGRMEIHSTTGIPLRVVVIPQGERLPNHNGFAEVDVIEFYDSRYKHTPDGQFIARYFKQTLDESRDNKCGLDLQGDIKDWKISRRTKEIVIDWAEQYRYGFFHDKKIF